MLVAFEGGDGVGKTTLVARLEKALQTEGKLVMVFRFPDRMTRIGGELTRLLRSPGESVSRQVEHLLFTANRWEQAGNIRSCLSRGYTVLVDRYMNSGTAYSVAKGLDLAWCEAVQEGLPLPTRTVYLHAPPDERMRRLQQRGGQVEAYDQLSFQEPLDKSYIKLYETTEDYNVVYVDASGDPDTVFSTVRKTLDI